MGASVVARGDSTPVFEAARMRSRCGVAVDRACCRAVSRSSAFWWTGCRAGCLAPGGRHESPRYRSRDRRAARAPAGEPAGASQRLYGRWSRLRSAVGGRAGLSHRRQHEVSSSARRGCVRCSVKHPLFAKLAAVRCALRWVLSIISRSGTPACATRALRDLVVVKGRRCSWYHSSSPLPFQEEAPR